MRAVRNLKYNSMIHCKALLILFSLLGYSQLSAQKAAVEKEKTNSLRNTCAQCVNSFWQKERRKITVYITFTLNPDSSVTNAHVTRSLCAACNDDAMSIFAKMKFPTLVKNVPVEYVHPIRIETK